MDFYFRNISLTIIFMRRQTNRSTLGIGAMLISHCTRNQIMERIRRLFGAPPSRLQAAALPWRVSTSGDVEVLLVTSRGTGRWVLPKGWPEGNEELSDAAAREGIGGSRRTRHRVVHRDRPLLLLQGTVRRRRRCQVPVFRWRSRRKPSGGPAPRARASLVFPGRGCAPRRRADLGRLIGQYCVNPRKIAA